MMKIKTTLHPRILVVGLTLLMACPSWAQQQLSTISQLRDQIRQMEAVDRDLATLPDVKVLNRDFLNTRRRQLHVLVVKRIDALRKYQLSVGASLTPEEGRVLENSIKDLEGMLPELDREMSRSQSSDIPVSDSLATVQSQRMVRTAYGQSGKHVFNSVGVVRSQTAIAPASLAATTDVVSALPRSLAAPACYPDVPERLEKEALATAMLIVNGSAAGRLSVRDAFLRHYNEMLYLTIADAVITDKAKINLRKLRWQEFAAETARTDKQTGASARSEGSTSAAEKPGFSDLLAFAIEHGAIQKEVNGTTLTLSSSPYALIAAAQGDTSDVHQRYDFFNRIGMAAIFNISNEDNVLANATRKQLSEWSVKFRLNRDRSSRGKDFQDYWDANVKPLIERRAIVLVTGFNEAFNKYAELGALRITLRDRFVNSASTSGFLPSYLTANAAQAPADQINGLQQEILCRLKAEAYDLIRAGTIPIEGEFRTSITQTITELASAQLDATEGKQLVEEEIKRLNEKPTSSLAYTNMRTEMGSDYSEFKWMYQQKAFNPMKVLANVGFSLYHKPDQTLNQQRVRDVVLALSFEGNAGRSPFVSTDMDQSPITFSFTGRYQRMMENRNMADKKADIAAAQFKLEIPVFTGLTFPLSITYTNATEEAKKDHVRFNFGFNFDVDKLAALTSAKRD